MYVVKSTLKYVVKSTLKSHFFFFMKLTADQIQEPIIRSMQFPYSVCETAFSQGGLFLDKPFPGISLRYFSNSLIIHKFDSQSKMAKFVTCMIMSLDAQ